MAGCGFLSAAALPALEQGWGQEAGFLSQLSLWCDGTQVTWVRPQEWEQRAPEASEQSKLSNFS